MNPLSIENESFERSMNDCRDRLQGKCTHLWVLSDGDSWTRTPHSRGFTCYHCQLYRANPDYIPPPPTMFQ
jgi:hypothetical protein